jgi:hypothetical protein
MLLARCGHDRRQVAAGGEPAWLITAAPARSARGRGRTPPARSGRVADPMDSHVQAAAGAGGPPNPQAEPLEARLTCSENTWARTTQPNSCRGPRTPGHIPGIATPIHLPSTADTPSMYFSWTAQRRDPPRAGVHRPGSVAGGSPRTGDRASCAWPTARRPSASLSLCRAADGLADQSTLLLPLAAFGPGLLLAGVCVVHGGQGPQHDRGPGPAVGEGAGLRGTGPPAHVPAPLPSSGSRMVRPRRLYSHAARFRSIRSFCSSSSDSRPGPFDRPSPDLAWLCNPVLTGLPAQQRDALIASLMTPHDQQRETSLDKRRGHRPRLIAPGVGRRPSSPWPTASWPPSCTSALPCPRLPSPPCPASGRRRSTSASAISASSWDQAGYTIQPGPHRLASLEDLSTRPPPKASSPRQRSRQRVNDLQALAWRGQGQCRSRWRCAGPRAVRRCRGRSRRRPPGRRPSAPRHRRPHAPAGRAPRSSTAR